MDLGKCGKFRGSFVKVESILNPSLNPILNDILIIKLIFNVNFTLLCRMKFKLKSHWFVGDAGKI